MFEKIKTIWKRFWKWILVGGATVAIAATMLPTEPIPVDLLLKVDKTKILESKEVDWIVPQLDGTFQNLGRIIKYDYISDQIVGQATYEDLAEDMSKRNGNSQFFKKRKFMKNDVKQEEWVGKFYSGTPFWKEADGNWYQTETATTTPAAFLKQTQASLFDKWFSVYAVATTTYAGGGDGRVGTDSIDNPPSWNTVRNVTCVAGTGYLDSTGVSLIADAYLDAGNDELIARGFTPYYTAGIPATATITTSTAYNYVVSKVNDDNDGRDYIGITETFQADHTTIVQCDYADNGYGDGGASERQATSTNIIVASKLDVTLVGISAYNAWDNWATTSITYGWIKKSGEASTCGSALTGWTCLGWREGHDIEDDPISVPNRNRIIFSASETAGTAQDPYLVVTYTVPEVATAAETPRQIIIFE